MLEHCTAAAVNPSLLAALSQELSSAKDVWCPRRVFNCTFRARACFCASAQPLCECELLFLWSRTLWRVCILFLRHVMEPLWSSEAPPGALVIAALRELQVTTPESPNYNPLRSQSGHNDTVHTVNIALNVLFGKT